MRAFFQQVFEEDALQWEEKLNRIHDVFDVWIDVQRRWVYLDGIFSGSADIKALLPVETQRFQRCIIIHSLCYLRVLSICQNWPARPASLKIKCIILNGWCCKIFKNNHSKNDTHYLKEI